jgi:hypothetical protein
MKNKLIILMFFIILISGCGSFSEPMPIADKYECSSNVYNCADFHTYAKALEVFEYCGGMDNDIHWLDGDDDGIPCESLK